MCAVEVEIMPGGRIGGHYAACGAGKTIAGMGCMERLQPSTLVLITSVTATLRTPLLWRGCVRCATTVNAGLETVFPVHYTSAQNNLY